MYHCSGCKQKFVKTNIAKFCILKNICRMCSHSQWVTDMEEQMCRVLHSRDQLELMNGQLQQQNKLLLDQVALLRQQVKQVQAPRTTSPSPCEEQESRGVCLGGIGVHLWSTLPTRGTHSTPGLHQPRTPHLPTISGMQPQPSPRTVGLTQPTSSRSNRTCTFGEAEAAHTAWRICY